MSQNKLPVFTKNEFNLGIILLTFYVSLCFTTDSDIFSIKCTTFET